MKAEKKAASTPEKDLLIEKLKTSLIRFPDKATTQRIMQSHLSSIGRAMNSRGDPFGRNDLLILSVSPEQEVKIPLKHLPVTLGSSEQADCIIEGNGVSRRHCRLERDGIFVKLVDTGSKNGTFLNRQKIIEETLCEGDKIRIGTVIFMVKRG